MYTPVFGDDGRSLIAFITVRAHWTDIGGAVFGSMMTSSSTDIYQEGVQFPALKFCNAGRDDEQILRMIARNSRIPEITIGDLQAQLAACRLGEQRLKEMMSRYGWDTIKATIDERWVRSELLARKRIEQVPDGTYEASCWLDNDGIEMDGLPFNFKVVIEKDEVTIDFTDIADQVKGPYNAGMVGGGITAAKVAYKYALIPDLHSDEGCFRPLKVILPPGKILSAGQGAPMARFNVIMATVIDGLIRALARRCLKMSRRGITRRKTRSSSLGGAPMGKSGITTTRRTAAGARRWQATGAGPSRRCRMATARTFRLRSWKRFIPSGSKRFRCGPIPPAQAGSAGVSARCVAVRSLRMPI